MLNKYFAIIREDGAVLASVQSSGDAPFGGLIQDVMQSVDWSQALHCNQLAPGLNVQLGLSVRYIVNQVAPTPGRVDP